MPLAMAPSASLGCLTWASASGLTSLEWAKKSAAVPVTCGVAIEVPESRRYSLLLVQSVGLPHAE